MKFYFFPPPPTQSPFAGRFSIYKILCFQAKIAIFMHVVDLLLPASQSVSANCECKILCRNSEVMVNFILHLASNDFYFFSNLLCGSLIDLQPNYTSLIIFFISFSCCCFRCCVFFFI